MPQISARPNARATTLKTGRLHRSRLASVLAVAALATGGLALAAPAGASESYAEQVVPARATATDACGPLVAKSTGSTWSCTFVDNFSGSTLDRSKWTPITTEASGFRNGPECFVDSPDNISVGLGVLTLRAKSTEPFTCRDPKGAFTTSYTGASVSTWGKFSQAYGRFEIRAAFPATKVAGVHSALWLWPQDQTKYGAWPLSGEIDIAEFYSRYPDRAIPYLHYWESNPYDTTVTNNYCLVKNPSWFHTYVAEWTPTRIKISYDGKTCIDHAISPAAPLTGSAPFDQPFIVALTQALGIGGNAFDPATTPLPAATRIDYVKVWS